MKQNLCTEREEPEGGQSTRPANCHGLGGPRGCRTWHRECGTISASPALTQKNKTPPGRSAHRREMQGDEHLRVSEPE